MNSVRFQCDLPNDPDATARLGAWLGARLRAGDVVALVGELGAGKTTFVRGLALGLGLDDPEAVASPTYLLVIEHPGPTPLLHADAYLPGKLEAFLSDGGLDYLWNPAAVVAVEWANRVAELLPPHSLWIELGPAPSGGRTVAMGCADPDRFSFLAEKPKMPG